MTKSTYSANWIALQATDFEVKAWHVAPDGSVRAHEQTQIQLGMCILTQSLKLIDAWLSEYEITDVLSCGVLRKKFETFQTVPCKAFEDARITQIPCEDKRVRLFDALGVSQAKPKSVMTAEAAMIAGYLSHFPKFDGVICIAAEHSYWVRVSAEEIVSFETYMTGEMLTMLSGRTDLKEVSNDLSDFAIFGAALDSIMSKPEKLAARIMEQRQIIQTSHAENSAHETASAVSALAGSLLGAEIASARPYWLGQDVVILQNETLSKVYLEALTAQGAMARLAEIPAVGLLGLGAMRKTMNV